MNKKANQLPQSHLRQTRKASDIMPMKRATVEFLIADTLFIAATKVKNKFYAGGVAEGCFRKMGTLNVQDALNWLFL